ncbi:MAG: ATP synthase F1 subunit delta [Thermoleophilia bacterium]
MSAATPYATALYNAAAEAGRLNEVDGELAEITDAVRENPALARALTNPAVRGEGKSNLLAALAKGDDPLVARFLQVLLDHRRLGELAAIQEAFADRVRLDRNELAVELTTAVAIDDATADKVQQQLASATGLTVTMDRTVDPTILGGVVLRVRDRLVDASLRRRLDLLGRDLRAARIPTA